MMKISIEDLKKRLTSEQYHVTQEKGTEAPFSGMYCMNEDLGMYTCIVCGAALFGSDTKFYSESGWPSFDSTVDNAVTMSDDRSLGMSRTEVSCKECGAHLGHVFDDGPRPTGKRYCVNSASLNFKKKK